MAAKKKPAAMCKCATKHDAKLREHNVMLDTTFMLSSGRVYPTIATIKIDKKNRARPPRVIPTYCPFCGVKYPE